jgi:hypothetical protein
LAIEGFRLLANPDIFGLDIFVYMFATGGWIKSVTITEE